MSGQEGAHEVYLGEQPGRCSLTVARDGIGVEGGEVENKDARERGLTTVPSGNVLPAVRCHEGSGPSAECDECAPMSRASGHASGRALGKKASILVV